MHGKVLQILKEYNCQIEFDEELGRVIIVDMDDLAFAYVREI
jgi:hypothetical protein